MRRYADMLKKVYECMNSGGYPQSNDIGSDLLAELRELCGDSNVVVR